MGLRQAESKCPGADLLGPKRLAAGRQPVQSGWEVFTLDAKHACAKDQVVSKPGDTERAICSPDLKVNQVRMRSSYVRNTNQADFQGIVRTTDGAEH